MANRAARHVTEEDRREFLKVLGVAGAVAVGGATLDDVRNAGATADASEELAPVGQSIQSSLTGELDATVLSEGQAAMADATTALSASALGEQLPTDSAPEQFAAIAAAGRPVYDHLVDVGFFESTTEALPEFDAEFLAATVGQFGQSSRLAEPLADMGLTGGAGVDLLSSVIGNAEELRDYHWVATDEIPRSQIEFGEYIPPMTQGAAGGALLWLEDLDDHLWRHYAVVNDGIVEDAVWHARSMAAGFQLMAEGARSIAAGESLSEADLGALLSTGFAVQALAQGLLPQDAYWITEEMRGTTPFELNTVTK